MKAGAAIRDITPKAPIQLCGYPESPISTGTHDPFYIAAFYFADAQTKILYLTADLLFFARARVDKITAEISGKTGVAQENILLAATHTHYGPAPDCDIYNEAFGPELCPEYMENVQRCAVEAAVEAVEHAFEAKLGYGSGFCGKEQGIGGNRHDPEKYAQDPEVQLLAIADETDTVRGILTGYALHPTVLPTDTTLASTDYVGYLRRTVEQAYPGAVFGFVQGCSGNQSSRYYRHEQSYREAARFGSTIGGEAVRVLAGLSFQPVQTPIAAKRIWYAPSHMRRIPPYAEAKKTAEKARADYETLVRRHAPEADCRSAECTKIGTEIMLSYARDAEKYGTEAVLATNTPIELHVVQLGGLAIASVAAEVFVEVGLAVKKASPFAMTMLSCLTGGSSQSYICSHYAYEAMYYEPSESLYGEGTAEELTEVLKTELQKLDQEGAAVEAR